MLAVCFAITACAPLPPSATDSDLQQRLVAGLDRCNASQDQLAGQLKTQLELLESQRTQMDALARNVKPPKKPVASSKPADCPRVSGVGDKQWVGQLEKVWLPSLNLELSARIDTGAETASLDARNIEVFERNGKRWVRFEIENPKKGDDPITLERKLSRMVGIIQSNSEEAERRPVIKLGITIGSINQTAEFTLSNRSHLDYQVLVGRNILKDVMVVDVSRKHIAPPVKQDTAAATAEGF